MGELEPLTGEPLILDLINTVVMDAGDPVDLLETPEQLRSWLTAQADRLAEQGCRRTEPTASTLAAVTAVRRNAAAAVGAARLGQRPPPAALDGLERAQRAAPMVHELAWNGSVVVATPCRAGDLDAGLAAALAETAVDLLGDPAITRVRQCAAEDCVLLFLPAHPRRTWCSASRCGNRARVARYYRRHHLAP